VAAPSREFTALASPWDGGWEVFVLDPVEGLIGSTQAGLPGDVETSARTLLSRRFGAQPHTFRLVVLRR